jgi:microsomal epoxide hydrolase
MTDSFASAVWFYHGLIREGGISLPRGQRCETPTAYAAFPGDTIMPTPPRSRVELLYNLTHWTDFSEGGHFAAMEKPILFADEVLAWGAKVGPLV